MKYLLTFYAIFFIASSINAMDCQKKMHWLKTNDNHLVTIDDKDIKKMHTLSLLLAHKKGINNKENPINASMITLPELQLLEKGLRTQTLDQFDAFYNGLAQEDRLTETQLQYTCGNQKLFTFINATDKANASCLRALCAKNFLYKDAKKPIISTLINDAMKCIDIKNAPIILDKCSKRQDVIEWSPDGKLIASINSYQYPGLSMYDAQMEKKSQTGKKLWSKHQQMGSLLIFTHNSKNIIIVDPYSENIIIFYASTGKEYCRIQARERKGNISCISCSHDDTKFAVGFSTGTIKIFNIFTGDILTILQHKIPIKALAFNSEDTKLYSVASKHYFGFSSAIETDIWNILERNKMNINKFFLQESEELNKVAFNAHNTKIAYGTTHNLIIWDSAKNNRAILSYHHPSITNNPGITALAFSPDCQKIIAGTRADNNHNLILWDTITKNSFDIHKEHSVTTLAFNPDGKKIVTGCLCNRGNSPSIITVSIDKNEINNIREYHYDCHDAWLLYYLCSREKMDTKKNSLEHAIFINMPERMQIFLKNVLS